jgi:hypothetical protein
VSSSTPSRSRRSRARTDHTEGSWLKSRNAATTTIASGVHCARSSTAPEVASSVANSTAETTSLIRIASPSSALASAGRRAISRVATMPAPASHADDRIGINE